MATYGATYTLTSTGFDRHPTFTPDTNPRASLTVQLNDRFTTRRARDHITHRPVPRRKVRAQLIKRDGRDTAISSTRSWTGITEWAMIPATPAQRRDFDEMRTLRKALKK